MPSATNAARDTDADWQRDWRKTAWQRLDDSDEKHEKTAIILERCINRLDEHDRRIKALEDRPERATREQRAVLGLTSSVVYTAISVAAFVVALLSHVTFH